MRLESRTWFLLSLIFLMGAVYFWLRGNEYEAQKRRSQPPVRKENARTNDPNTNAAGQHGFQLLSQISTLQATTPTSAAGNSGQPGTSPVTPPTSAKTNAFPHRLTNTGKPLRQLVRDDRAILMRNAFIDTAEGINLAIPNRSGRKGIRAAILSRRAARSKPRSASGCRTPGPRSFPTSPITLIWCRCPRTARNKWRRVRRPRRCFPTNPTTNSSPVSWHWR